eukprot:symbB.v1.2.028742.t1/scaffold3003.1/size65577/1
MGVQGYLPKSPESVIYSNPTALGQRPLLQNLQSNDEPVVSQRTPCRSVALAVGGGLSLSAFTLNWLGRKNRRPRTIRRPTKSVASPVQGSKAKQFEALDATSCMSCLDKRKKTTLDVQYLYATPILRPGSSGGERLPALRWQEEAAAVREALEIDTELDSGTARLYLLLQAALQGQVVSAEQHACKFWLQQSTPYLVLLRTVPLQVQAGGISLLIASLALAVLFSRMRMVLHK